MDKQTEGKIYRSPHILLDNWEDRQRDGQTNLQIDIGNKLKRGEMESLADRHSQQIVMIDTKG
jgi:hypothetical protein